MTVSDYGLVYGVSMRSLKQLLGLEVSKPSSGTCVSCGRLLGGGRGFSMGRGDLDTLEGYLARHIFYCKKCRGYMYCDDCGLSRSWKCDKCGREVTD